LKVLLISIRPQYAEKILSGEKTIEFRRVRPNVQAGDLCLMYASGAQRALVGAFTVGGVVATTASSMWRKWRRQSGTDRASFMSYFDGTEIAYGLLVQCSEPLGVDIPLEGLRTLWPGFHPPQSFRFLDSDEALHRVLLRRVFRDLDGRIPHPSL